MGTNLPTRSWWQTPRIPIHLHMTLAIVYINSWMAKQAPCFLANNAENDVCDFETMEEYPANKVSHQQANKWLSFLLELKREYSRPSQPRTIRTIIWKWLLCFIPQINGLGSPLHKRLYEKVPCIRRWHWMRLWLQTLTCQSEMVLPNSRTILPLLLPWSSTLIKWLSICMRTDIMMIKRPVGDGKIGCNAKNPMYKESKEGERIVSNFFSWVHLPVVICVLLMLWNH